VHTTLLAAILFAASVTLALAAAPKIEPLSEKELANLKASARGPDAIFIWHGNAELMLHATVVDSATQKPIAKAKVTAFRDRRVARGANGRSYKPVSPRATDRRGRATLKGDFPAKGAATGFCVFVLDSYVAADAPGYASTRSRISPIYRLDFPRKTKDCVVSIRLALKAK